MPGFVENVNKVAQGLTPTFAANVETVAENILDVNAVAADIIDVAIVADNIDAVVAVGPLASGLTTVVTNITEILAADDNAAIATTQAGIATTQATAAADSAASAATSKTDADNAALAAAASATTATTKASEASTSATNAASSAVSATTSASTATTKAGEASASASSAATSANTATTKANEASTSATNAGNSATSASTSASNAAASASTATTKAAEASASASAAAGSAASALVSAVDAEDAATAAGNSATAASLSATSAAASASSAASLLDQFDDRYLGAKASDPSVDNDGNSLLVGALYYNTVSNSLKIWTGTVWNPAAFDVGGTLVTSFNTRTGDVTLTSGDVTTALGFTPEPADATIVKEATVDTLTNKTLDDVSNLVGADHVHYRVRNSTGSTINIGTVVKASATQPGTDYILIEPVTDPQTQVAIGIVHQTLVNNAIGLVINTGVQTDFNTSAWAVGTILYPNTTGGFTSTKPTSGQYQACAYVLRQHSSSGTLLCEFTEPKLIASTAQAGYVQLNNTLTSTSTTQALTAAQGKVLNDRLVTVENGTVQEGDRVTLTGDVTGTAVFDADGNVSITTTVVDDSHNHVIANVDGLQNALDGKQPLDATLTALAGVTTAADKIIYATASDTFTTTTLSSFGRSLIDDADAATALTTLGAAASSHVHGDISNTGTISTAAVTPANTDYLLLADASNSNKIQRGVAIGTGTTTYLRNDGTWATPPDTNTTYSLATASVLGLVKLGSDTVQTTANNAVTATASRTYAVQKNGTDQLVVNVPWTDTVYTLPASVVHDNESGALHPTDALRVSGTTLSLYKGDGSFESVTTQDTVYTHPTTDGYLHVPATGTTNNGKVLTAGATAGSFSWQTPTSGVTDHTLLSNIGTNTHDQIDTALTRLANTSGTNTGDQTTITGNAGSATVLQTARTINGVSFDGSANITVEPYVEQDTSTDAFRFIAFVDSSSSGYQRLNIDTGLIYNPSTNSLSTTSFNGITGLRTVTPLMDGVAAYGSSTFVSRDDHVHPTDTSRAPIDSPAFTGTPTAPTAAAGTDTTQIATTEFVQGAIAGSGDKGTFIASYELADGTNGAAVTAGLNTYPINTVNANTISGASLASNTITLPAGKYIVDFFCKTDSSGSSQAGIYKSDLSTIYASSVTTIDNTYATRYPLYLQGYLDFSIETAIKVVVQVSANGTFGTATGFTGVAEKYGTVKIIKVA